MYEIEPGISNGYVKCRSKKKMWYFKRKEKKRKKKENQQTAANDHFLIKSEFSQHNTKCMKASVLNQVTMNFALIL